MVVDKVYTNIDSGPQRQPRPPGPPADKAALMPVLRHARLVLPAGVVQNGWLRTEGERVAALGGPDRPLSDPGAPFHDLYGHYVVPGFVDMHVHGGGGGAFSSGRIDEARRAADFHLNHGTTTIMASTVTGALPDLEQYVARLAGLVEDGVLAGIHLEGPFLARSRCGAHDPNLLRDPEPGAVRRLLKAGRGAVRMMTLAPELEHGSEAVRLLADTGVIAAIGHTDATYAQAGFAITRGASVASHIFNAMRPVHHREPGPATAALERDEVFVEVISDGLHVHPSVVGLVFRAAGADRTALITDATQAAGSSDGRYPLGPLTVDVRGGAARVSGTDTLAGSTLTMDSALRNTVLGAGVPIEQAAVSASLTPARALGLDDRIGTLEPGKYADLVVLDDDLRVVAVMRRGRWVGEVTAAADTRAVTLERVTPYPEFPPNG
jgi:N-acetylglucosamine-6-phosphate deacetylase